MTTITDIQEAARRRAIGCEYAGCRRPSEGFASRYGKNLCSPHRKMLLALDTHVMRASERDNGTDTDPT